MKAVVYRERGRAADVLSLEDLPTPEAGARRSPGPAGRLRRQSVRRQDPQRQHGANDRAYGHSPQRRCRCGRGRWRGRREPGLR